MSGLLGLVLALLPPATLQDEGGGAEPPPVPPQAEAPAAETPPEEPPGVEPGEEAGDETQADALEEPPGAALPEPIRSRLAWAEVEARLDAAAAEHPDLVQLEPLGRSAGARPLRLAAVTDLARGAPAEKPALLVLAQDGGYESHGGELALQVLQDLLLRTRTDAAFAAALAETTFYIAPAVDPDRRDPAVVPRHGILLDRNFPIGWRPASLRPGAGPFPLKRPEAEALVRFLHGRPNIALLVVVGRDRERVPGRVPGPDLPLQDLETYAALAAREPGAQRSAWVPWSDAGPAEGRLLDHAYQALGIFALELREPGLLVDGDELATWLRESSARVLELAGGIPRLALELEGIERVGTDLWQLDLRLENRGRLPTASALAERRGAVGPLEVYVRGTEVVASAYRRAGERSYEVSSGRATSGVLRQEALVPGEKRWLRVVARGLEGDEVEIEAGAPRAGGTLVRFPLP